MADSINTTNLSRRAMLGRVPAAALATTAIFPIEALAAATLRALAADAALVSLREPLERNWKAERDLDGRSGISDKEYQAVTRRQDRS